MKISQFKILACFLLLAFLSSCTRDEVMVIPPPPETGVGVYVLSEGSFNQGSSKLSFYNSGLDSFYVSIFSPGVLGLFPDGLIENDDNLYVTEQGNFGSAGKIHKLEMNGSVVTSADIGTNPYSMCETNGRLYVTNGPSNTVLAVNRENLQVQSTINVRNYPQEIIGISNRVFVCNTGSFSTGDDSVVSVIDAGNNQVIGNIVVGKNPSTLARSSDDKLLVGCPGDSSTAKIFKIDPVTQDILAVYTGLTFGLSKDIVVGTSNLIYFIGGSTYNEKEVVSYSLSTGASQIIVPQIAGFLNYGLQIDITDGRLYVALAASDFSSSGRLRIYSTSGSLVKEFAINGGVTPRRIIISR